jgi:hypothetical protein
LLPVLVQKSLAYANDREHSDRARVQGVATSCPEEEGNQSGAAVPLPSPPWTRIGTSTRSRRECTCSPFFAWRDGDDDLDPESAFGCGQLGSCGRVFRYLPHENTILPLIPNHPP